MSAHRTHKAWPATTAILLGTLLLAHPAAAEQSESWLASLRAWDTNVDAALDVRELASLYAASGYPARQADEAAQRFLAGFAVIEGQAQPSTAISLQALANLLEQQPDLVPGRPGETTTTTSTDYDIQGGGLALTHEQRTVTEVFAPVDSATMGFVGASFLVGGDVTNVSGTLGLRLLDPAGDFPAREAASRNAVSLEVGANVGLTRINVSGTTSNAFSFVAYVTPAIALLSFDGYDELMQKQGASGFKVGAQGSLTMTRAAGVTSRKFNIGPELGYDILTYNPGSAQVRVLSLTALIVPFGGFSATFAVKSTF